MRYRERFFDSSLANARERWYRGGALAFDNTISYSNVTHVDHMWDVKTIDFKKRQAEGNLVYNPMYREVVAESGTLPVLQVAATVYGTRLDTGTLICRTKPIVAGPLLKSTADFIAFDKYFNDNFASERNGALTAAWANVDQTQLLIGATVGELPETIEWLCNCFRRLNTFLKMSHTKGSLRKFVKKARKKSKPQYVEDSLNAWMETRYALRPFLYEIVNATKALKKVLLAHTRFTARGFTTKLLDKTSNPTWNYDGTTGCKTNCTVTGTYQARAGVFYALEAAFDNLQLLLGLDKPMAIMYELTKLSFAVDWFLNLGQFIASWEKNASFSVLGSWVTEKISELTVITTTDPFVNWEQYGYTNISKSVVQPGSWVLQRSLARRVISTSRPIHPSIRINLDWMKIIDLVAITKNLLRISATASK